MAHVAQQIREKLVDLLHGLATTGDNVFASRPEGLPLSNLELPCLIVSSGGEEVEVLTIGFPQVLLVRHDLHIDIYARERDDLDDVLDTIQMEVQQALHASTTSFSLSGLASGGLAYLGRDAPEYVASGDQPTGHLRLRWQASYQIMSNAPASAL